MTTHPEPHPTGIERAVTFAGSQAALADLLQSRFPNKKAISQQAISQFVRQGYTPAARAREIAAITGVPVAELLSPALRDLIAA